MSAEGNTIRIERDGATTIITIERPQVLNAIDAATHDALQAALDDFAADDRQRVCILTGTGDRAFCAGTDLASTVRDGPKPYPRSGYAGLIERYDLDKPLIAAVNGLAFGGGFEIALACDIIVAAETAQFALPEPLVGVVAIGGGLHRLSRQIGLKQAMGMILTGRRVGAEEGLRMGFVNEVVPAGTALEAARHWSADILKCAPDAIRASKQTVMRGLDEPTLADAIARQGSYPAFQEWIGGEEPKEGPRAFVEKRKPNWVVQGSE